MFSSKRNLVAALFLLALLLLIAATQVWVHLGLVEGAAAVGLVSVTGQQIATGVMPMSLALLAIAVTLTIAGRVMRVVLAVLAVTFGGWIAVVSFVSSGGARNDLVAAAGAELSQVTGLGASEHPAIVADATSTAWPVVSAVAGVLIVAIGVSVFIVGRGWKSGGRKYESGKSVRGASIKTQTSDRISDWDSLSDGDDPSLLGGDEADVSPDLPANSSPDSDIAR